MPQIYMFSCLLHVSGVYIRLRLCKVLGREGEGIGEGDGESECERERGELIRQTDRHCLVICHYSCNITPRCVRSENKCSSD